MITVPCEGLNSERVGKYDVMLPGKDGPVSLLSLDQAWRTSDYGRHFLHQPPRYVKRFDPDINGADVIRYLGPDACPQGHQDNFLPYIDFVLDKEDELGSLMAVSTEDRDLLYFVAMFHDIGELTHPDLKGYGLRPVGDIPFGKKTPEDRQRESDVRLFIFNQPPFNQLDKQFVARAEMMITHDRISMIKLGDSTFHLHEIYEAAHDIVSVDTALNAQYYVDHHPELKTDRQSTYEALISLAAKVKLDHAEKLASEYSYLAASQEVLGQSDKPSHTEKHEGCSPNTTLSIGGVCATQCIRLLLNR